VTASSSWTTRRGELATLLQLAQLDTRIRQAERSVLEIARQLNEHRFEIETLGQFVHNDRVQLTKRERCDEQSVRLEQFIDTREKQIAQMSERFDADRRRVELPLERAREIIRAARAERGKLLPLLARPLVAHYESLAQRGATPFIVPVRGRRCGGCALPLSRALVDVLQRPDVIAPCPRCGRILYGRGLDA
jgi:hypothetical protein